MTVHIDHLSTSIQLPLLSWWDDHYVELPWRKTNDPYAVWISEIMLQQTQIATVIPYYQRWMQNFPDVHLLAAADLNTVLKAWQGLGYYSRARNIHRTANQLVDQYEGKLPDNLPSLLALPGIGPYTAGAIASIAFGLPAPVLDGNVIRVFSRLLDLSDDITQTATKKHLWAMAAALVPHTRPGDFNQALMELGQHICRPTKTACHCCPIAADCLAHQRGTQLERPVRPPRKNIPHYDVAAGVITRADGKMLITRRPLDGMLGGLWEFPGGKQEKDETLEQTLIREIAEETGIGIMPSNNLLTIKHAYTHFRITLHVLAATYVTGNVQHIGVIDHAWVTIDTIDQYAFATTNLAIIQHLKTMQLST